MKRTGIVALLMVLVGNVLAQETTRRPEELEENGAAAAQHKVLVIPFDQRLYNSNIDSRVAAETGLSAHQIKTRFRHGLTHTMVASGTAALPTISLFNPEDEEMTRDLSYVYQSIGYEYLEVPVESTEEEAEPQTGAQKLVQGFTRLTRRPQNDEDRYVGGEDSEEVKQLEAERYMNTKIHNPKLLSYLQEHYEADVFVFINQLDISEMVGNDSYSYAKKSNMRRIKVHYTIFDHLGQQIYGGSSVVYFPAKVNDLNGIIKGYFPNATDIISGHLPQPQLSAEEAARKEEMDRKAASQRSEIDKY